MSVISPPRRTIPTAPRKNLLPFEFVKPLDTEVDEVVTIDGEFDSLELITEGSCVALVATRRVLD